MKAQEEEKSDSSPDKSLSLSGKKISILKPKLDVSRKSIKSGKS
jgi:hypothetical protein